MPVKETTERDLLYSVLNQERVILKYHNKSCGHPCHEIIILFEKLSETEKYKSIAFLSMDAEENPAILKLIQTLKQPFTASYYKGVLLHGTSIGTGRQLEEVLDQLLYTSIT
jgi:3-dehydroquinate dehydratase